MRNEAKELIGINKNVSSKINLILENNAVETITLVDGDIELPQEN
jgi:hypothetical protein